MSKVKLDLVEQTEIVSLYSIKFEGQNLTEFERFLEEFKNNAKFNEDFNRILYAISKILGSGAFERQFRPEGKMQDGVCAVPLESGSLRLYCLRLSDQILMKKRISLALKIKLLNYETKCFVSCVFRYGSGRNQGGNRPFLCYC